MFSKQHYKVIANLLSNLNPTIERNELIDKFTKLFEQDSKRFSSFK